MTASSLDLAYLKVFGVPGGTSSATMPLGDSSDSNILDLAWNRTTGPVGNPSWDYFCDFGEALSGATFNAVPEPATRAMLIGGLGQVGFAARIRRPATA